MTLLGERIPLSFSCDLMDNVSNSNFNRVPYIDETCAPFPIPESLRNRLTNILDSIHQFTIDQGFAMASRQSEPEQEGEDDAGVAANADEEQEEDEGRIRKRKLLLILKKFAWQGRRPRNSFAKKRNQGRANLHIDPRILIVTFVVKQRCLRPTVEA